MQSHNLIYLVANALTEEDMSIGKLIAIKKSMDNMINNHIQNKMALYEIEFISSRDYLATQSPTT